MSDVKTSKYLSYVLRHQPESIGLDLDAHGWADVTELLARSVSSGLTRAALDRVVANNDKKRFEYSPDGLKIRASQGHSVNIDLSYEARTPPEILFHGTVDRFLDAIRNSGLMKMKRHHVHLSADMDTAQSVGDRRGKHVVLRVRAAEMDADGHSFFLSTNGVWLTEHVPPEYIEFNLAV
ncbi:MAG: RNA 2'-phosphotransferase [Acidobacteria bacterium]|nr:RNA 2'-phosphotransferase [Acidobacteriota bacterium]